MENPIGAPRSPLITLFLVRVGAVTWLPRLHLEKRQTAVGEPRDVALVLFWVGRVTGSSVPHCLLADQRQNSTVFKAPHFLGATELPRRHYIGKGFRHRAHAYVHTVG